MLSIQCWDTSDYSIILTVSTFYLLVSVDAADDILSDLLSDLLSGID